ncbi:MAG: ABC transporter permease [Pseudomonadota bacterium]
MSVSSSELSRAEGGVSAPPGWAERLWAAATSLQVAGSVGLAVLLLAAWQWLPGWLGIPAFIIPPASDVWAEFLWMTDRGALMYHTAITFFLVVVGFVIGCLLGAAVGYLLGISRNAEIVLSPYILALQIAPKVAFAPLFVLWFGYTFTPKILVAVLIVFFPVLINVLGAVRAVDQHQIDLARSFKATRLQIFSKIELPASMPAFFAGLRIGSTLAVIGVVVGELVGGNTGLGYLLTFAQGQANTPAVFVTITLLTLIGIIVYLAVVIMEGRVLRYMNRRTVEGG